MKTAFILGIVSFCIVSFIAGFSGVNAWFICIDTYLSTALILYIASEHKPKKEDNYDEI